SSARGCPGCSHTFRAVDFRRPQRIGFSAGVGGLWVPDFLRRAWEPIRVARGVVRHCGYDLWSQAARELRVLAVSRLGGVVLRILRTAMVIVVHGPVLTRDDRLRPSGAQTMGYRQARPVPGLAVCQHDRFPVDLLFFDPRIPVPVGGEVSMGWSQPG